MSAAGAHSGDDDRRKRDDKEDEEGEKREKYVSQGARPKEHRDENDPPRTRRNSSQDSRKSPRPSTDDSTGESPKKPKETPPPDNRHKRRPSSETPPTTKTPPKHKDTRLGTVPHGPASGTEGGPHPPSTTKPSTDSKSHVLKDVLSPNSPPRPTPVRSLASRAFSTPAGGTGALRVSHYRMPSPLEPPLQPSSGSAVSQGRRVTSSAMRYRGGNNNTSTLADRGGELRRSHSSVRTGHRAREGFPIAASASADRGGFRQRTGFPASSQEPVASSSGDTADLPEDSVGRNQQSERARSGQDRLPSLGARARDNRSALSTPGMDLPRMNVDTGDSPLKASAPSRVTKDKSRQVTPWHQLRLPLQPLVQIRGHGIIHVLRPTLSFASKHDRTQVEAQNQAQTRAQTEEQAYQWHLVGMHRTPSEGRIEAHEQAVSQSQAKLAVQRQAVTQAQLRSQHRLQAQASGHGKSRDVGQTRTLGVGQTQSEAGDTDDDLDSTDADDQFDFHLTIKGSSMPLSSQTRARVPNRTPKGSSLQATTAQVKEPSSQGRSMWYVQQSQTSSISNVPSGSTTARRPSIYIPTCTCPPEEGSVGTPEESHRYVGPTGAAPGGEEDARQAVSPASPDPSPPTPEEQDDQDVCDNQ